MKGFIKIIVVFVVVLAAAFFIYSFIKEKPATENVGQGVEEERGLIFPFFSNISGPEADRTGQDAQEQKDGGLGEETAGTANNGNVIKIAEFPVSGWKMFKRDGEVFVRYNKISNSNVFETPISNPNKQSLVIDRFLPNSEKALFSPEAESVLFQYVNNISQNIQTYLASIEAINLSSEIFCPFSFPNTPALGTSGSQIVDLHNFLNKDSRTAVSLNEADLDTYSEESDIAVRNFQSLYGLSVDGKIGPNTRAMMGEVCLEQEKKQRAQELEEIEVQYTSSGSFLPENILEISVNPSGSDFFYLLKKDDESFGIVQNFNTAKTRQIFQSPFTEWVPQWVNESLITLTTKPSGFVEGFMFTLNPKNESLNKEFGEFKGLTTNTNPSGDKTLVGFVNDSGEYITGIYSFDTNSVKTLSITTIPEKCAWKDDDNLYCGVPLFFRDGVYPDDWYKGSVSFDDVLMKIDVSTDTSVELPAFGNRFVDIKRIEFVSFGEPGEYLIFIDKGEENLWLLEL